MVQESGYVPASYGTIVWRIEPSVCKIIDEIVPEVSPIARTAKELSQEELQAYRPWQNLQRYRKDPEVDKRCDRAWDVARRAAGVLKEQFGASKVVVFGSLVRRAWFTPWSDVDLAAWGIPLDRFFRAVGAVQDLGAEAGFNVDVVDPAECNPEMLQSLQTEGIEL